MPKPFNRTVRSLFNPGNQFCYGAFAALLAATYSPIPQVVHIGSWPIPIFVLVAIAIGTGINVLWTRLNAMAYDRA